MMRRLLSSIAAIVLMTTLSTVPAEPGRRSPDGAWTTVAPEQLTTLRMAGATPRVRPERYHGVALDAAALRAVLDLAPLEETPGTARPATEGRMTLPLPDGTFGEFAVVESPVYEPGLFEAMAAMGFPQKTYRVWNVARPAETGRIDFGGPAGFFAMVRTDAGTFYIDPFWMGDDRLHVSYWRRDYAPRPDHLDWRCHTPGAGVGEAIEVGATEADAVRRANRSNLLTYRFACAATGEYTAFHGGTVVAGQAAVTTMTNRVNSVYEIDLGIRLILLANNSTVIYTNSSTDPYTGTSVDTMLGQVRTDLNAKFGEANYDAGHVVSGTGSGGIAGAIGNICQNGNGTSTPHKAQGATAWNSPIGDPFDIDYVAHELGHQFAGRHPFAYCGGGPGDSNTVAYEPGSGSTIMAYAGICGAASDLQSNSDAMFHIMNILQIDAYVAGLGGGCAVSVPTDNANGPTVSAGPDVSIPAGVPFELTATGFGDADGDSLTFAWEQADADDTSPVAPASLPTSTAGPVYRSRLPTTSPTRTFPPLANVLAGTTPPLGERISTIGRAFRFRVTARDNNSGVGRVNWDEVVVTTVAGTTFAVTSPNGGESLGGPTTITWNAGTTASSPINATAVDIFLSTDGGNTFPITLAENVPNNGSAAVTIPGPASTTARVKIKGRNNVFFDVSNANFTITSATPVFAAGAAPTIQDTTGNGNANGALDPGETDLRIAVNVRNSGGAGATAISATLTSLTATATVLSGGPVAYPDLAAQTQADGAAPFVISIDPSHPCGNPVNLRVAVTSAEATNTFDLSLPTGRIDSGADATIFSDGFEGGTLAAWSLAEGRWASRTDAASLSAPRTGSRLGSFEPATAATTAARLVTPDLPFPKTLTFYHAYVLETGTSASQAYDGAFLEISTDGGQSFTQIPAARITTGTPYNASQIADSGCASGATVGTAMWSGTSSGAPATMTQVVVDLTPWSSQTVRVAFRYNEDCGFTVTNEGWYLDDVTVVGAGRVCDPPASGTNEPPTVTIVAPASDQTVPYGTTSYSFGGSAADTDGTVTLVEWRNNSGAWTAATGTTAWAFEVTGMTTGANVVDVRATDDDGDTSLIATRTITRSDNVLPTVTILSPASDQTVPYTTASIAISGSASDPDGTVTGIQVFIDGKGAGSANGTTTWEFTSQLRFGVNVFEVRALDDAGGGGPFARREITRSYPPQADVLNYLLGISNDPAGLDVNRDGQVNVADLLELVNL